MRWNLVFIVLFSSFCLAQKEYAFDYLLEYKNTFPDGSKTKNSSIYFMTNSANNEFVADFYPTDSLSFSFLFLDYNHYNWLGKFPQTELLKSENVFISCKNLNKQNVIPAKKRGAFGVTILKDSLINGITYAVFEYRSLDKKREKRKKLNHEIYFVDKNTAFHLPIKYHYSFTAENELQKLPNGIVSKKLVVSYNHKIISEQKLVSYTKIDKKVTLEMCD